jgi:CRP/FNR family transcriptional regulator, cyclic AMP receptor protein
MNTSPKSPQWIRAAMQVTPWFAALPDVVRSAVIACARPRFLKVGDTLFEHGEDGDGLFVVLEGTMRLSSVTSDGHETVLDFYGPGFWFGEVSPLAGEPRAFSAQAHDDTWVVHISSVHLEALLESHAPFSRALLRLEAQRLLVLLGAIETYSALSMEQRLAARLLMLAERFGVAGERGLELTLDLSHETLARLTGSTRQRVNTILNAWQRAGMMEHHYGRVVLSDLDRLQGLARR